MLYLKGCTRCGGDVYLDRDGWGAYMQCLQCGQMRDIPDEWLDIPHRPSRKTVTAPAALKVA